jgi:hypothetical protein
MNIHYNTDSLIELKPPLLKLSTLEQAVVNNGHQEGLPVFTALLNQQSLSDKKNRPSKAADNSHHSAPLHTLLTLVQQALIKTEPVFKPKKKQQQRHNK